MILLIIFSSGCISSPLDKDNAEELKFETHYFRGKQMACLGLEDLKKFYMERKACYGSK